MKTVVSFIKRVAGEADKRMKATFDNRKEADAWIKLVRSFDPSCINFDVTEARQ